MVVLRKKRWRTAGADLDVTPFMNLMIVLVPVLLLSLVFTHTTVIDLDLPGENTSDEPVAADQSLHLEVQVLTDQLVVGDERGVVARIPALESGHDLARLSAVMWEVKQRRPQQRNVALLLEPQTDYQTLVHVMDRVRSRPSVAAADAGTAGETAAAAAQETVELFPVISLGDVPPSGARSRDASGGETT